MDDVIDDLLANMVSLEQNAIFLLLMWGERFSKMTLYRRMDCIECGVLIEGKPACSIKLVWPDGESGGARWIAKLVLEFYPPYQELNKAI